MKVKVIGIATGSKDVEVWGFDSHDDTCKRFCELLVRNTHMNVIVLEGEVIGTYSVPPMPVNFTADKDRFNKNADTVGLPDDYGGN